ncbi:MAG TPA: AAA family ATPase [Streptosporangiaceae bacterium]|nr:AAA family ATPase [Streptosporangiaceae bacterium]
MNVLTAERELLGRDRDLALIEALLAGTAGLPGALLVLGEPGVGKTALLDAAATAAAVAGVRVVRAAGVEFEADLPFSGLHQLLLPLHEEFSGLARGHRYALNAALGFGDGAAPDRLVVCTAVLTVLRRSAATRPLLMVVDDLPWLDRASAAVLGLVSRRLAGSQARFLGAARTGRGGFFQNAGLPELDLRPLDDDAAGQLLSARFPELVAGTRERVLAEARGNPLALLELPPVLRHADIAGRPGLPPVLPLSRRLQALFAAQVEGLPAAAQRLLLLAALDATGDLRILDALGTSSDGLAELAAAERAELAHVDANTHRLAFRHPLIRSAVVELATEADRRQAHRQLAALFAGQPDRRAWHLAEATQGPDEQVAGLLEDSAQRVLQRGDATGAVAALARAAELSPGGAGKGRRLAQAAYIGADMTGDLRPATRLLAGSRASSSVPLAGSLQAAVTAAHLLLNGDGDIDTAHRLLTGAVADQAMLAEAGPATLGEALYTLMLVCFFGGRPGLWGPLRAAVARLGASVPAVVRLSGQTLADPARTAATALPQLDMAIAGLAGEVNPAQVVRIALATQFVDRQAACRTALWQVVRGGTDGGTVASALNAQLQLSRDAFWTGQWDEAQRLAEDAAGRCREHGYVLLAWPGRHVQALIAAARGDYGTAGAVAAELLQWATPRQAQLLRCYAWQVHTLAALGRGDFDEAYRQASKISPAGTLAPHVPYALLVQLDLVEAAARAGHHAEAAAHVTAIRAAGVARLSARQALVAHAAMAITAADDRAPGLFEQALAVPGADRWPFDVARVHLLYGERLRRTRVVTGSRAHLLEAQQIFSRLGAAPWAQRAATELRAAGQALPQASACATPALTPQEREIALLAASGLTNKQIGERLFLSHRTVGFHLHRLFPKLGVSSRAALRDALPQPPP